MADELERALLLRDLELMGQPRNPNAVQPGRAGLLDVGVGLPERLSLLNQIFNPVEAIGQSMNAGERMMSPNMGVMDRLAALGDMASGIAGVVAPVAAASRAGTPAATALMEGLLGGSPDEIARFAADEAGSLPGMGIGLPTPRSDAEAMARDILQLRAEGRAGEVTNQMMAAADPQYMYFNTPLPMDAASRMARAEEMGKVDPQYHATLARFSDFMPSETGLTGRGVYSGDFPTDIEDYARKQGTSEGLNIIPLLAPSERSYARRIDWQNLVDADEAFPWNATVDETVEGFKRAAETMSGQGYSGVRSQPGERVTFDPSNIRSRFARFDPEFRNLSNLSASLAAAGVPLGLLAMLPEEEQY